MWREGSAAILPGIRGKAASGGELDEEEQMRLIVLPLAARQREAKLEGIAAQFP